MQHGEFNYHLPEHLIANYPANRRSASRLLCLNATSGSIEHRIFHNLVDLLRAGDLLVFNDTRVIPARLYGEKESGGKIEVLIERTLADNRVLAQVRASKSPKPGTTLQFYPRGRTQLDGQQTLSARVDSRAGEFFLLVFSPELDLSAQLKNFGHIPLPPYIKRSDEAEDEDRYQTVYAASVGAVAAPTAGLHFDKELLSALESKGIEQAFLTLHVGAGTFQPVRVENIKEHRMHKEFIELSERVCRQVQQCKERGGRVIAVGTTTVRSLEAATRDGKLIPFRGETDIFIYPGFQFHVVDAMITNFHLPESTLLMLVSAFASKKMLLDAYHEAINQEYRFFSYGDAMFIYRSAE